MTPVEKCFHCGLPLNANVFTVTIDDIKRHMCCIGCQAIAEMIVANNLNDYYVLRDQDARSQAGLVPLALQELVQYDNPDVQSKYLKANQSLSRKEITLLIEGITCAACVWLIEKRINSLDPAIQLRVNLGTHRAELTWNDAELPLSKILYEIAKLGFRAKPYRSSDKEQIEKTDEAQALKRLAVSGFGFGQVMMFSIPLYAFFSEGIPDHYRDFFRTVTLIVTTPILAYCGLPYFKSALYSLKSRHITMSVSISLALCVIYLASLSATIKGTAEVYFDSIMMLLFFVTLSRYIEMRIRHRASFIAGNLNPQSLDSVTRLEAGQGRLISVDQLAAGDCIIVKSGELIPADGKVIAGTSAVSEAFLSGESLPKLKSIHSEVLSGSLNIENPLTIKVSHVGTKTRLATIIKLFEDAQTTKPAITGLAERFAHYFVSFQVLGAISLFAYWFPNSLNMALSTGISLLVICCPCALALATPIALTATMNALAKMGFLCTRSHVIEGLEQSTDFIFDKTGTLTEGSFSVDTIDTFLGTSEAEALRLAASLESSSEHPIATAFRSVKDLHVVTQVKILPNRGIRGIINNKTYVLGSRDFIATCLSTSLSIDVERNHIGTEVFLASDGKLLAAFSLTDRIRKNASDLMDGLKAQGKRAHVLSGDHPTAVEACAKALNITNVRAACSPQDKLNYVKALQAKGAKVVMIGDGINDAPVLMQAEVSIAMAQAADISRVNSDALLLKDDLSVLLPVLSHVHQAHRIIRQCLAWAVIYNVFSAPLAFSGHVAPWLAALFMSSSSIFVVANASRLMKYREKPLKNMMPLSKLNISIG